MGLKRRRERGGTRTGNVKSCKQHAKADLVFPVGAVRFSRNCISVLTWAGSYYTELRKNIAWNKHMRGDRQVQDRQREREKDPRKQSTRACYIGFRSLQYRVFVAVQDMQAGSRLARSGSLSSRLSLFYRAILSILPRTLD